MCDELGIFAWSELIFSDALYPINSWLLESIEPEVRQNVRRINRHPSNVQWAGGNEIEGIVRWTRTWVDGGVHYMDEVRVCFCTVTRWHGLTAALQFVTLFQHFLHDIVVSETKSVRSSLSSLPFTR